MMEIKMKTKKLIILFCLAFLILFSLKPIFAQETEIPEASLSPKVEYSLPYPGILPDHPLYFLKVLRDRILDILIQDPIKRIEFNLLMADKRLNMGIFLMEKGKPVLAETTVSKGEKYFLKVIEEIKKAKDLGREVDQQLLAKLKTASFKHEEVILELLEKAPDEQKVGFNSSLELVKEIQEKIGGE